MTEQSTVDTGGYVKTEDDRTDTLDTGGYAKTEEDRTEYSRHRWLCENRERQNRAQ